ncbi:MAG: PAS domain S-box protein [Thermodesulfobacteriota bacterium]
MKDSAKTKAQLIGEVEELRRKLDELKKANVANMQAEAEEEIRKLSRAVEQSPATVLITDTNGDIEYVNPKFTELTGYSFEEVKGKNPSVLKTGHTKEEVYRDMWGKISSGGEWKGEFLNRKKNGELYWENAHISAIKDQQGNITHYLAVKEDITARKAAEKEALRAQKLESVGLLAGGLAHDFNNLLTSIIGNVSLAKLSFSPNDNLYLRLDKAEKASRRAAELTRQLLTFSRRGETLIKTVSVAEVVREALDIALRGTDITEEAVIPDDLLSVEADEGQISQVISNLIINAKQAMPCGGAVRVECKNVTLKEGDPSGLGAGRYVTVSVRDNGAGMGEKVLQKIFDPYFTTKETGSGLGLATSYSIIKNHDGHIAVESKPGCGATFTVFLPASVKGVEKEKDGEEAIVKGNGRILVMDDDTSVGDFVCASLEHSGYEVRFVSEGSRAVEEYRKAKEDGVPFSAVIMDLTVKGGMGGRETIKMLLREDPDVKAIVSSGYSNDPAMTRPKEYGFKETIAKPYRAAELSKVVYRVVRGTH